MNLTDTLQLVIASEMHKQAKIDPLPTVEEASWAVARAVEEALLNRLVALREYHVDAPASSMSDHRHGR